MALGGGGGEGEVWGRGLGDLTKLGEEHTKGPSHHFYPYRPLQTAGRVLCSSLFVIRDDEAKERRWGVGFDVVRAKLVTNRIAFGVEGGSEGGHVNITSTALTPFRMNTRAAAMLK